MDKKTSEQWSRTELIFLGFDPTDYGSRDMYESGNSPSDRIERLMKTPGSEMARENLYKNIEELDTRLSTFPEDTLNFDQVIKQTVIDIVIENADDKVAAGMFIKSLDEPSKLFKHLQETRNAVVNFSKGINQNLEGSRGQLLTIRQLLLMEFVATTHDLGKLLGSMNAQIDSDHEVIYKNVIGKYLVGKSFISSQGALIFEEDDVRFIVGLASFHEDLWREETFAEQTDSLKRQFDPKKDVNGAIERARMIFHFIDICGEAIGFDNNGLLAIKNNEDFEERFVDLYRRHIKLPIKIEGGEKSQDWTRGKVSRAKWALGGVTGLTWTLDLLRKGWNIKVSPNLIDKFEWAIIRVLNEAEVASVSVIKNKKTKYVLTPYLDQTRAEALIELEKGYKEIVRVKKLLEAEMSG